MPGETDALKNKVDSLGDKIDALMKVFLAPPAKPAKGRKPEKDDKTAIQYLLNNQRKHGRKI